MNILFVSSIHMWGGGEVWLMDMLRGLSDRGHRVSLVCREGTELSDTAAGSGFDTIPMRLGGDFDPFVIARTYRVMKSRHIDVVCSNMDKDLRFGGIAAKLAGVRGVVPSREIDYPLKNTWRYRYFYNRVATEIVVNSEATRDTLLSSAPWLSANRLKIIYKGIDLAPYDKERSNNLRQELGLSDSTPIVTFVGQLDERKGIRHLLHAWKLVHASRPEAVLLLVGKGDMEVEIGRYISMNELEGSVVNTGFRNDIPDILRQSTMLVLPSLWEGFGYVLVEAMAARIPTVASDTSSLPEIVEHERSGLLVPPAEPDPLSRAILSLLSDPVKASGMGMHGRKIVEERFTLSRMLDEFETVFRRAALR